MDKGFLPIRGSNFDKMIDAGGIEKGKTIMISGGTGSGKTTALNSFIMFIPNEFRIVTIEDTLELKIEQPNTVRLESKAEAHVTMDSLLKNALRMRPDRILVGEVRGPEAVTLFNAMNTGHEGCMGTLHANSARETIIRVTNPPMNVPYALLSSLDLIVMLKKIATPQGPLRVISEISEIAGAMQGNVRFNILYHWDPTKNKIIPTVKIYLI